MGRLLERVKEEVIHSIPAILFFLLTFNLINFTESLMLRPLIPNFGSYLAASIGALCVGKLLIIVNSFSFINAFPHRPLIYNISWKFLIYGFFTLVFRVLEAILNFYLHEDFSLTLYEFLFQRLSSPIFWAVEIWVLMLFMVYVVSSEFTRVLGKEKILQLLFKTNHQ